MKTPHIKTIGRSLLRLGFLLISLALGCFALLPQARAGCQQGCDIFLSNTFLGYSALVNNDDGSYNTAIGDSALRYNTTGTSNTATGSAALGENTDGSGNTANGEGALVNNTSGDANTAIGGAALSHNITGGANTATGSQALFYNNGNGNTANGVNALVENTTGANNTAIGADALDGNTTGGNNIAVGHSAGSNLTTGSNNIDIGNEGLAAEFDTIRIGSQGIQTRTFIAGIAGAGVNGRPVMINGNGRLGTAPSSERFKQDIKVMDEASEAVFALKPVTFRYKHEVDPDSIPQFGLVAEEVEKVNPDLVARDGDGKPYTVRYDAVNAMLLNEFLKQHRKVEELEAALAAVKERLKAQDAKIDKVSDQLATGRVRVAAATGLEMSKAAPQMVLSNQ